MLELNALLREDQVDVSKADSESKPKQSNKKQARQHEAKRRQRLKPLYDHRPQGSG